MLNSGSASLPESSEVPHRCWLLPLESQYFHVWRGGALEAISPGLLGEGSEISLDVPQTCYAGKEYEGDTSCAS